MPAILRLILAVLAGYAVVVVTTMGLFAGTGHDPHAPQSLAFMATSVVVGVAASIAGGYLASSINAQPTISASRTLGFLIAVGAAVSLAAAGGSRWSQWVAMLTMAPAALAGGVLWLERRR